MDITAKENPTYTFRFLGRYEFGINKFLLPIKISLFCWFAGARTTAVYVPVYLKTQGLTITHLSVFTALGVASQFIMGVMTGMIADKIGRVILFLYLYGSVFLFTVICFIYMPKIDECDNNNITFKCLDQKIIARNSCQILQDSFFKGSCSLVDSQNETHFGQNENCSVAPILLQRNFSIEKYLSNDTSTQCTYQVNFGNYSSEDISLCDNGNCEVFQIACYDEELSSHCHKNRSFWIIIYGILVVLYINSRSNTYRFFDVITMDLVNQFGSDFGKQRLWSILGLSVGPPLAGLLSHMNYTNEIEKNYTPVFVCAAIFAVSSFIPTWRLNPKFHQPALSVWKKSCEFVMNFEIILFFILLLITGISFGFIITYGNWYLQDMGASDLLLGVSTGLSALFGFPLLYMSKWFFSKIGLRNFFVLSLLAYAFYCFSFSLIREPWLAIGIELVTVFAYQLFWASAIEFCDGVAPAEIQATMKNFIGSLHYNIAKLGAVAIGGYMMNTFNGRMAYRVIGSLSLGYAIIYGCYLLFQCHHKKKSGVQTSYHESKTDIQEISRSMLTL